VGAQINASSGALSDAVILDGQTQTRDQLEATFDGTRHVLLFEQWDYQYKHQLRAADTNGASASLYTVVEPTDQLGPADIASAQDGTSLAVYTMYDEAKPHVQDRLRYRLLGTTTPPAPRSCPPEPCESGFIVDGVCCDSPCGLGRADDCMACSVALGAAQDGVCGYVHAGRACRAATATCMTPPTCSGQNLYCPDDGSGSCTEPVTGVDAGVLLDAGTSPHDAATPTDAGQAALDAGPAGPSNDTPRPTDDATTAAARDAATDEDDGDDAEEDPLDDSDGAPARKRSASGCGCSVPDARDLGGPGAGLAALTLVGVLVTRRRGRQSRAL